MRISRRLARLLAAAALAVGLSGALGAAPALVHPSASHVTADASLVDGVRW